MPLDTLKRKINRGICFSGQQQWKKKLVKKYKRHWTKEYNNLCCTKNLVLYWFLWCCVKKEVVFEKGFLIDLCQKLKAKQVQ